MKSKLMILEDIINNQLIDVHLEFLEPDGSGSLQHKVSSLSKEFATVSVLETDTACILYTSGTTGQPNGAMLSHQNLLSSAKKSFIDRQLTQKYHGENSEKPIKRNL